MASTYVPSNNILYVTPTTVSTHGILYHAGNYGDRKVETKKEKVKRIAAEMMYASWKTYNDKTITVKELKQICKPKHVIKYINKKH